MNLQQNNATAIRRALQELGQLEQAIAANPRPDSARYYDSMRYFVDMLDIASCLTPQEIERFQLVKRSRELVLNKYISDPCMALAPRLGVLLTAFRLYDALDEAGEILGMVIEVLCQDVDRLGSMETFWSTLHDTCLSLQLEWLYIKLAVGQQMRSSFAPSQLSAASLLWSLSPEKEQQQLISLLHDALARCSTPHAQRRYMEALALYFARTPDKGMQLELAISKMLCRFNPDESVFLPWMPILFFNSRRTLLKDASPFVCAWASDIVNMALEGVGKGELHPGSLSSAPRSPTIEFFDALQGLDLRGCLTYQWNQRDLLCESIRLIGSCPAYQWHHDQLGLVRAMQEAHRSESQARPGSSSAHSMHGGLPAVVFDTNAVFDMVEEIVHFAGKAARCFAIPQTVLNELIGLKGDRKRRARARAVLSQLSSAHLVTLLLGGGLSRALDTDHPHMENWSGLDPSITCCDEAILHAVLKHGNAILVSNDVNLMLKGTAWSVRVLPWHEFIGTQPWSRLRKGK